MNPAYFSPVSVDGSEREHVDLLYQQEQDHGLVISQLRGLLITEPTYVAPFSPEDDLVESEDIASMSEWRRKICQWCYRVVDHFRLNREVVSVAMNLFDRFLPQYYGVESSSGYGNAVDSRTYQLSAMTCLYIAIKLEDQGTSARRRFRLCSFVDLSRGQFSASDIEAMEVTVLSTLQWRVSTPTPMTFISYLLALVPTKGQRLASHPTTVLINQVLEELSRYLTELTVCLGSDMSCYLSSRIAAAAILVSLDLLSTEAMSHPERAYFIDSMGALFGLKAEDTATINHLRSEMQRSLWPEMLFDACTDAAHPIIVARDNGLLDVSQVYNTHDSSLLSQGNAMDPPRSPVRQRTTKELTCKGSPVSVTHA